MTQQSIVIPPETAKSARLLVELADEWGQPVSPLVRAMALADETRDSREVHPAEPSRTSKETRRIHRWLASFQGRARAESEAEMRSQLLRERLESIRQDLRSPDQRIGFDAVDELRQLVDSANANSYSHADLALIWQVLVSRLASKVADYSPGNEYTLEPQVDLTTEGSGIRAPAPEEEIDGGDVSVTDPVPSVEDQLKAIAEEFAPLFGFDGPELAGRSDESNALIGRTPQDQALSRVLSLTRTATGTQRSPSTETVPPKASNDSEVRDSKYSRGTSGAVVFFLPSRNLSVVLREFVSRSDESAWTGSLKEWLATQDENDVLEALYATGDSFGNSLQLVYVYNTSDASKYVLFVDDEAAKMREILSVSA